MKTPKAKKAKMKRPKQEDERASEAHRPPIIELIQGSKLNLSRLDY